MLAALAIHAGAYVAYVAKAVAFPFGLDYGEGTVWQQARLILGPEMASDLTHPPFVVFNYTPILPLLVRGLAALGVDQLYGGRAISLVALATVCGLMGTTVFRGLREPISRPARFAAALVVGLAPLTFEPVQHWAMQMRSDMLAAAFSTVGIYLAIDARGRTAVLCGAVLAFVLALYTKQTELSAPVAALLVCALVDFRATFIAAIFGLVVGGAALVALQIETHGGFWRHAFAYNVNRFAWRHVAGQMLNRLPDLAGLLAAFAAFCFLWWRATAQDAGRTLDGVRTWLRGSVEARTLAVSSLWLIFATALLVTAGKHGASSNYFIEWLCVSALPIGLAIGLLWQPSASVFLLLLPALMIVQALDRPVSRNDRVDDPSGLVAREKVVDLIRDSVKPVVSEDLSLLMRAGRTAPIEPSTLTEMASVGAWDPKSFLDEVRSHAFGFFVTETPDARLTPEMFRVVEENYPVVEKLGPYLIRRPGP